MNCMLRLHTTCGSSSSPVASSKTSKRSCLVIVRGDSIADCRARGVPSASADGVWPPALDLMPQRNAVASSAR